MKIQVNYDLLSKLKESKTGFSLDKSAKYIFYNTSFSYIIGLLLNLTEANPIMETLKLVPYYLLCHILLKGTTDVILKDLNRAKCTAELILLMRQLNDFNINTNYDLLLKSYEYKTNYKIKFDESFIPYLKQDKYIMVPTYDNGEEKEISLLQEHVIGSKQYVLSHGSPKKVLKLAFNPI